MVSSWQLHAQQENLLLETSLFPNSCSLLGIKFLEFQVWGIEILSVRLQVSMSPVKSSLEKTAYKKQLIKNFYRRYG